VFVGTPEIATIPLDELCALVDRKRLDGALLHLVNQGPICLLLDLSLLHWRGVNRFNVLFFLLALDICRRGEQDVDASSFTKS
jgi:hypothetical protein